MTVLLDATLAFVDETLSAPRWDRFRTALSQDARTGRAVAARPLPATRWLNGLEDCAAPETRALCAALSRAGAYLPWGQTYTAADFGPAFLERYCWMELVGQRGPFASDRIACGFLLLGPDITYPRHRHEAEEIYLVLAGTAAWLKGEGDFAPRVPGTLIHHPPWCWHAMRTGEEPLLALYLWSGGDLTQKSQIAAES